MNKVKVNLALMAAILGISAAFVTKPVSANANTKRPSVTWSRLGTVSNPSSGNAWVQQDLSSSCKTATRICTATFSSGYDPNAHTYADNQAAAVTILSNNGYNTQP